MTSANSLNFLSFAIAQWAANESHNPNGKPVQQEDISDEHLMEALVKRESYALEILFDRYAGVVKAVIYKTLNNEAETEDLLSEVFLEVWNQATKYSASKGKPLGWVVTIARRRAIDKLRSRSAYQRATDRFEAEIAETPGTAVRNAEDDIVRSDLRETLDGYLAQLPEAQRTAVELAFYKGMSQREIAAYTDTPLGTIKTRIELGLKKLYGAVSELRTEF